jgi:NNP family nitrate/nitrite transporter-like MFS transporter
MLPMAAAGLVFFLCAKDSPTQPGAKRLADYLAVLREADAIWFCFFYAITFGGFVGLASFLGVFFHDQYLVSKVAAGDLTALCVVGGSFMRPVGGMLADRHGGIRVLGGVYGAAALLLVAIATLPGVGLVTPLFIATLALLSAGNGAVFQLVPIRFSREIGVVTGLVGAAGGLGGFFLPSLLGFLKDLTGTYASGFAILAALCVWAMTLIVAISGAWRLTWATEARSA